MLQEQGVRRELRRALFRQGPQLRPPHCRPAAQNLLPSLSGLLQHLLFFEIKVFFPYFFFFFFLLVRSSCAVCSAGPHAWQGVSRELRLF